MTALPSELERENADDVDLSQIDRGALELVTRRALEMDAFTMPVDCNFKIVHAHKHERLLEACDSVLKLISLAASKPRRPDPLKLVQPPDAVIRPRPEPVRGPRQLKDEVSRRVFADLWQRGERRAQAYLNALTSAGAVNNQSRPWTYNNLCGRLQRMKAAEAPAAVAVSGEVES